MQHEKIQYYLNPDPCGHVEKAPLKKMEVNFTNEVMEVKMFLDGG